MIKLYDPAALAKLKSVAHLLYGTSHQFAADLIYKHEKYKGLSDKQMYWVNELTKKALAPKPDPVTMAAPGTGKLAAMFETAKVKLKHPRVTFVVDNQPFQLSLAGPKAKFPGSLNITDGRPFGVNQWFGRIVDGVVTFSHTGLLDNIKGKLEHLITSLNTDPEATASEYGKMSGRCCFCNKNLTDPESLAVGYGAVCAAHYGLKWGNVSAKAGAVYAATYGGPPKAAPAPAKAQDGAPALPRGTAVAA